MWNGSGPVVRVGCQHGCCWTPWGHSTEAPESCACHEGQEL